MSKTEVITQAMQLSERERLQLAEELWASIADPNAYPDDMPLPEWQRDLLDKRLEESKDDPGRPWPEVRAELWPERA